MKSILIQEKSTSELALRYLERWLGEDFQNEGIAIETTRCLFQIKREIKDYSLIFSHPEIYDGCCLPKLQNARDLKIPIIITYVTQSEHLVTLEAVAANFKADFKEIPDFDSREFYRGLITKLKDKF